MMPTDEVRNKGIESQSLSSLLFGDLPQDEAPTIGLEQEDFNPLRFGRDPYILWVDMEAFKETTNGIQSALDCCGYQKLWKFKTVERMKIFLKRSLASEYIRSGTKYVLVTSYRDGRGALNALSQTDVVDKLGMVIIVSPKDLPAFPGSGPYIRSRVLQVSSWAEAASALIVWRYTIGVPTTESWISRRIAGPEYVSLDATSALEFGGFPSIFDTPPFF